MCACTWGGGGGPLSPGTPPVLGPPGGAVPSAHPHLDPPAPSPLHRIPSNPHPYPTSLSPHIPPYGPPTPYRPPPHPAPPPISRCLWPPPSGPCPDAAHKGPRLQVAGRDKAEPKWGGESNHLPPPPKSRGHTDGLSHGNPSAPLLLPVLGVIAAMGGIWGGVRGGKGGGSVNYCAVSVEEASLAHGKPLTRKPCTGCDGGV